MPSNRTAASCLKRSSSCLSSSHSSHSERSKSRSELDIVFTDNVQTIVAEWTLKENMKVASCKREEIGVYVFRDWGTNQSPIT
jgi:hypothetical protein